MAPDPAPGQPTASRPAAGAPLQPTASEPAGHRGSDPGPWGDESRGLVERLDAGLGRLDAMRDRPALSFTAGVILVAVVAGGWWLGRPGSPAPVEAGIPFATTTPSVTVVSTVPETALVHVAGAVARPGVVALEPGSRIGDALTAAGGPTAEADVHQLNLAAPVVDGLQVRVPVEGEKVSPTGQVARPELDVAGGPGPVDVNTATPAELETLPGIGPALAAAIVEWRSTNGPFAEPGDLLAVPGIGPAKLDRLVDRITL